MSITVRCGGCGKGYRVGDDKAGKRMRCKGCRAVIEIPDLESDIDEDYDDDDGEDYGEEPVAAPSRAKSPLERQRRSSKQGRSLGAEEPKKKKKPLPLSFKISIAIAGVSVCIGIAVSFLLVKTAVEIEIESIEVGMGDVDFVKFVAPGYTAALVLHPAKIIKWEVMTEELRSELIESIIDETGIDPRTVDQIALLLKRPSMSPRFDKNMPITVVKFNQPTDVLDAVERKIKPDNTTEEMHNGQAYLSLVRRKKVISYTSNGPRELDGGPLPSVAIYTPDNLTAVVGLEKDIKAIIDGNTSESLLQARIKEFGVPGDFASISVTKDARKALNNIIPGIDYWGEDISDFLRLLQFVTSTAVSVDVDAERLLHGEFELTDNEKAAEMLEILNELIDYIFEIVKGEEVERKRRLVDFGGRNSDGVSVSRSGNRVSLNIMNHEDVEGSVEDFIMMWIDRSQQIADTAEDAGPVIKLASRKERIEQIGSAMLKYHEEHNAFPLATSSERGGRVFLSWRVQLLPYLGEQELYDKFNLDEPWDSSTNMELVKQMPDVFLSDGMDSLPGMTRIKVFTHNEALFDAEKGWKMSDILDGPENTLLALEASSKRAVIWSSPSDTVYLPGQPVAQLGYEYAESMMALMADGSARMFKSMIPARSLNALVTPAGKESGVDFSVFEANASEGRR